MASAKTVYDLFKLVTPINGHSYESAQDILTRLKFIGMLQPGDKIDRNLRIERNTLITPIKRMFYGEGRDATYAFLFNTIERGFAILYSLAAQDKVSDNMVCAHILYDMHKAVTGIQNMQNTYKDDKMFVCNLETLIQTITAKMLEVQQRYPDIHRSTIALITSGSPLLSSTISTSAALDAIPPLTQSS